MCSNGFWPRFPSDVSMRWEQHHLDLARRLGLTRTARLIVRAMGPWIVPTASAEFALRAAGMLETP